MLKKSGVILLCLLVLAGCGNPTKKAEKEVSAFLSKEFAEAKKICLAEHSEDECAPIDFVINYNKESDIFGVHISVYHDSYSWSGIPSNVEWTGTYENPDEFSAEIYKIVRNSGVECDVLVFGDEVLGTKGDIRSASARDTYLNGAELYDESRIPYLLRLIGVDTSLY